MRLVGEAGGRRDVRQGAAGRQQRTRVAQTELALGTRARHFAFETEVLIRAAQAGVAIRSVPVKVFYPPVHERVSHFRPFIDTVRIIFVVLGLIFRLW